LQIRLWYGVRALVTTLFVGGSKTGEPGETFCLGQCKPKARRKVLFFFVVSSFFATHCNVITR
jgi:hypothetical protein